MNTRIQDAQQRSRLGRLLVERGIITEAQLHQAIARQSASGGRLGEVLVELQFATQRQIDSVLRKQHNIRLVASVFAVLMTPLYAMGAGPARQQTEITALSAADQAADQATRRGMTPLDDEAMSEVSGQGIDVQGLLQASQQQQLGGSSSAGLQALGEIAKTLNPLLAMLDYNMSIKGVVNGPDGGVTLNQDGSVTMNLDMSIAELDFSDIRVKGTPSDGPSLGSVTIHNIELTGTSVTIRGH